MENHHKQAVTNKQAGYLKFVPETRLEATNLLVSHVGTGAQEGCVKDELQAILDQRALAWKRAEKAEAEVSELRKTLQLCREAANRDLEAKRSAEAKNEAWRQEVSRLREALEEILEIYSDCPLCGIEKPQHHSCCKVGAASRWRVCDR